MAAHGPDVEQLCRACVSQLPDIRGAGVAVMTESSQQVRFASDGVSARLEQLQLLLGEGPCRDAFHEGHPVLADDLQATIWRSRWPAFAGAAVQAGARALFALPLRVGGLGVGVLDLYRDTPGPLDGQQLTDALDFADAVTDLLLAEVLPGAEAGEGAGDGYWAQRAVVHQATGMISVQLAVPVTAAFVRLRAHAYAAERGLEEVAEDVVARRLRFTAGDGEGHDRNDRSETR